MNGAPAASAGSRNSGSTLFLLFSMGGDRYALGAGEIVSVLPVPALKRIAEAPGWVAGVFVWQGQPVPVLDLGLRAFGVPTPHRTSTRLVLVAYGAAPAGGPLGLILERATDTLRCDAGAFRDYGLDNRDTPYLGPVYETPQGVVQRIQVAQLLPADVQARLFPTAQAGDGHAAMRGARS